MGRSPVVASKEVGRLLRDERTRRGWTLRDVEARCRELNEPVHFTTLARIERGHADPGLRRLHVLLKIYDQPFRLVEDLLEIEMFAGQGSDAASGFDDAVAAWRSGDPAAGFAALSNLRARATDESADPYERQRATLGIAVTVGTLGRYRLSRHLVEELLLEPPDPRLLVPALVQAAVCWHWLGSGEVALGLLERARVNANPGEHGQIARIQHERASTLLTIGRIDDAERALAHALDEYRRAGDTFGEAQALGVRVRIAFTRGDHEFALTTARAARAQAARHGHRRQEIQRTLDEGLALSRTGRQDEGLNTIQRGLGLALAESDPISQFYGHYYLWQAYRAQGERERATVELSAARYFQRFVDAATPEARQVRESEAD